MRLFRRKPRKVLFARVVEGTAFLTGTEETIAVLVPVIYGRGGILWRGTPHPRGKWGAMGSSKALLEVRSLCEAFWPDVFEATDWGGF